MANITVDDITSNVTVNSENVVTGDGVLDKLMETVNKHIIAQFDAGRIKGTDIAQMYIGIVPSVMQESIQFVLQQEISEKNIEMLNEQIKTEQNRARLISKQTEQIDIQIEEISVGLELTKEKIALTNEEINTAKNTTNLVNSQVIQVEKQTEQIEAQVEETLARVELTNEKTLSAKEEVNTAKKKTDLVGSQVEYTDKQTESMNEQVLTSERKRGEDDEKWYIAKAMMENQKASSDIDLDYKELNAKVELDQKKLMLTSAETDILFNESKREVMDKTRKDNVRMKAAEQYAEFLKYISAANAVPGEHHFRNLVGLIESIDEGVLNENNIYSMLYLGDQKTNKNGELLYYVSDPDIDPSVTPDEKTSADGGDINYPVIYKNDTEASPSA